MPSLYKDSRKVLKKKIRNSLSKGNVKSFALPDANKNSRFQTRVMSTSPESTRNDPSGINSPSSKNQIAGFPQAEGSKTKLSAYLTKVTPKLKLPKVDSRVQK